jgi:hypothetical protein
MAVAINASAPSADCARCSGADAYGGGVADAGGAAVVRSFIAEILLEKVVMLGRRVERIDGEAPLERTSLNYNASAAIN